MKNIFKGIGIIFAILFLWAAYVQNNDSDAATWYAVYGLAAVASILFVVNRLTSTIATLLSFLALVGTYFQWPLKFKGFEIDDGDIENIEQGREAFGLLIIAILMFIFALRIRFKKN